MQVCDSLNKERPAHEPVQLFRIGITKFTRDPDRFYESPRSLAD
jgi:hypothetical protein